MEPFEDACNRAFTKQMTEKLPLALTQLYKLTNQQIVTQIIDIIGPDFEFSYLPCEDSIGNIPLIDSMDILYFTQTNKKVLYSENKYKGYVDKIRSLNLPIDSVNITKFSFLGKFIEVKLMNHYLRYISKYKEFVEYKSQKQVASQIDRIYNYLNSTVLNNPIPREFIEWVEFSGGF
jgi:hypothetical protein